MPGENKLLRLSFTNLQDCIANGIGKNRLVWIAEIRDRNKPIVLVDAVEATKTKTVITDQDKGSLASISLTRCQTLTSKINCRFHSNLLFLRNI